MPQVPLITRRCTGRGAASCVASALLFRLRFGAGALGSVTRLVMGDNIVYAVLGLWILCIIVGLLWFRWWGAVIAIAIPIITYPAFFVWYLLVQYASVLPAFSPAVTWKPDLYAPWKALAIPAGPSLVTALVVIACLRDSPHARLRSLKAFGVYLLFSLGSYVIVAVAYTVGNLRGWPFLDATMSSLQLILLGLFALGIGLWIRSATTVAGLMIVALPIWPVGVIIGRWGMIVGGMILGRLMVSFS